MEFLKKCKEFKGNMNEKINNILSEISIRDNQINGLYTKKQELSNELDIEFNKEKVINIKDIDAEIEDIENEKEILNKNIDNIKSLKMEYDMDMLRNELTSLLTKSEMNDKVENILKLKKNYLDAMNDLEAYAESLSPILGNVKYHLVNTLDGDVLEERQEIIINRDYAGKIFDVRVEGMNIPYLPQELDIDYKQFDEMPRIRTRVDKITRGI